MDLAKVRGSGPKGRITREDVQAFVKGVLAGAKPGTAPAAGSGGGMPFNLPELANVDFAKFGPVETKPLSRIKKISGAFLHRNWISIPHITQFDEADITELESFRKANTADTEKQGFKLTMLAFLIKASVTALRQFPDFNASLDKSGENLVMKKYFHIGVAVDTPEGLVVPVIRDADRKGVFDLARELAEVSKLAKEKKLKPGDMQGGTFSISSLGGIGGTMFTPIINAPEVAILGVSRSVMRPGLERQGVRAAPGAAPVPVVRPPRDRRRRRGALHHLPCIGPVRHPQVAALDGQADRDQGPGHRGLQGSRRHRDPGQAGRHDPEGNLADHRGVRQGHDGDPVACRGRGQRGQGQARRQGRRRQPNTDNFGRSPRPGASLRAKYCHSATCRRRPRRLKMRPAQSPAPAPAKSSGVAADYDCDVVVLGSGPGGYSAAFRSADLGKKVVLVERYATLGGVCLNVGCIPSKALLHVAAVMDEAAHMAEHGISFGKPAVDLAKLRAWKDKVVGKLTTGLTGMAKLRKVTVVQGMGSFIEPNVLAVETKDGRKLVRFASAIIAAGSQAAKLPFLPEDPRIVDSTGALELKSVPKRMLVIGGGIIGLEMGTVYSTLGTRLDVVEMMDALMAGPDRDLVAVWQKYNAARFDNVMLKTKTVKVEATPQGIKAWFEGDKAPKDPQTYDLVLVSVGRSPNGNKIGAEKAGIAVNERGFIPVDSQMRTNVPHIFAIGDIVGQPMLAHKAVHEGHVAAEAAAGEKSHFDASVIPGSPIPTPKSPGSA